MDEILKILEDDARISYKELTEITGLSEEEIEKKVKEYVDKGIIKRFKAVIDLEKVGEEKVYAIVDLKLNPVRGEGYDLTAKRISNFPQVKEVYLVSGAYDLSVLVEGDNIKDVAFFVSDKLATLDRVYHTTTHFILKKYKEYGETLFETEKNHRLAISL
ncbi:MAG: Lrp/AsnC family transcriptional regulator [Candidatus Methanoliparum thermophilum]|uniref:Lrp/AsnC family transcriptional regulator n=1 Tax=Methanoliparum thermophilum TaxID=2491083 RepID=A0A520KSR3_METT2|nr:Lrp/AsnC family transcriptional regulator [Candidatus Methanoliparum sp. LAM-1]RZN64963.1 MAG: Lrp/AsnC family transcriptional regulator [Candidatus Methanoliparum thermophilum]BDC36154.1 Lrp/AsnC family transcriptional regulator [Candidatus Methanoliparum sp. LAM-1]